MVDRVLYDWAPLAIGTAAIAFILDWSLTHLGNRASRRVQDRWQSEGSYELNPSWEEAIDSGRPFTGRLVSVGLLMVGLLVAFRYLPVLVDLDPAFFAFTAGTILLLQAPIMMAHGTNLHTYRALADPDAVEGRILFRRWFLYGQSAWFMTQFAALWFALWLPSQQAFFLGGAVGCLLLARWMFRLAKVANSPAPATSPPAVDEAPGRPGA
jgi:hypothetical protein